MQICIGVLVFRLVANEYKQRDIWLHPTICNIWSPILWAIMKVILNYLPLLSLSPATGSGTRKDKVSKNVLQNRTIGANTFALLLTNEPNKLECLSMAPFQSGVVKHSSLLGPFVRYEENGVLWLRHPDLLSDNTTILVMTLLIITKLITLNTGDNTLLMTDFTNKWLYL